MFRLSVLVLTWWLVTGSSGGDGLARLTPRPDFPPTRRQVGPERETGAITVEIQLPPVISHINCPPPRIPKQRLKEKRHRALLKSLEAR